jgi:hypothetical protein
VPAGTDVNQASAARVHDYYLGGWHHFPADRWVGDQAVQASPGLPAIARANREFLQRAVRFLAGVGVRQFIDLGSGIPTAGQVHEIAQQADPQAHVVYVDVDPVAVAHGHALLAGIDTVHMVRADLRDVPLVLAAPAIRQLIDFTRPIGVLAISVLHLLPGSDDPAGIVARYRDAVPAGSYLAVTHPVASTTRVVTGGQSAATRIVPGGLTREGFQPAVVEATVRTRQQVAGMFAGWQLVAPGLVNLREWRPDPATAAPNADDLGHLGGVGHKT